MWRKTDKLKHLLELCQTRGILEMDLFSSRIHTNYPSTCLGKSSLSVRTGCFPDILGSQVCVCFHPISTHRNGFSKSKSGSVSNAHNNSSMASPTMPFRAFKNVCRKLTTSTSTQKSTERSCRKVESSRNA